MGYGQPRYSEEDIYWMRVGFLLALRSVQEIAPDHWAEIKGKMGNSVSQQAYHEMSDIDGPCLPNCVPGPQGCICPASADHDNLGTKIFVSKSPSAKEIS